MFAFYFGIKAVIVAIAGVYLADASLLYVAGMSVAIVPAIAAIESLK
jgi:hypothetical protein